MENYITLISGEGDEFVIPKKIAKHSKVLSAMLEGESPFSLEKVPLMELSSRCLELICQYLCQKEIGVNPKFLPLQNIDLTSDDGKNLVIDLLLAADYLDC
jgi:hypothetical protein